ncbi:MAG: protein BatD, partial [Candidatus Omnitrophica bacterium]|nr:protein BatD [Candidatus Omnitrophota bacterium]
MKYSLSKKTIVMITAISCVIACVAMTLGLGGNAYAEDTPVSISIDKQSMPLGDSAIFTIQVKKGEITPPQIPETEDLAIAYIGAQQESFSSFHVVIVNGQMQTTRSGGGTRYQYRVVPKRMGVLTFPSVDINVDGKVLRTNPFTIEVLEQIDLSQNVMLIQQLDKNEIYLGQGVRYTFKWYFNKDIEGYECNIPWMASLKNIVVRDPVLDQNKQYQRFVINGTDEVFADKTTETYNGQQYAVVIFEKILYPLTAGDYELTPAVLRCDVVKAYQQQRPSSFFDNFFRSDFDSFFGMGRKAITEPYSTSSAPITLVVKDVPAEGRPDAFVNAIGQYQFGVTLSSTHVKVGEPITLTMSIIGEGNLEQVDMPPLPAMDDFKGYDPESRISRKTVNGHELIKKDFQKVIIPTHAGTFSVPEIQFAYFDPQAGAYNTLKQGPFEITADKAEGYDEEIRLIAIDSDKGDNGKEIQ